MRPPTFIFFNFCLSLLISMPALANDEVLISGDNFQLKASELTSFLQNSVGQDVQLKQVEWIVNPAISKSLSAIPIIGTGSYFLRTVHFTVKVTGTDQNADCVLLIQSQMKMISLPRCSSLASKAQGTIDSLSKYILSDEVVVSGETFQLKSSQLTKFMSAAIQSSVKIMSVSWNSNTVLVPILSIGTDDKYLRTIVFSWYRTKTFSVTAECQLIVDPSQDQMWLYHCDSEASSAVGHTEKLSDYSQ